MSKNEGREVPIQLDSLAIAGGLVESSFGGSVGTDSNFYWAKGLVRNKEAERI